MNKSEFSLKCVECGLMASLKTALNDHWVFNIDGGLCFCPKCFDRIFNDSVDDIAQQLEMDGLTKGANE